jgi:hypothetical protein
MFADCQPDHRAFPVPILFILLILPSCLNLEHGWVTGVFLHEKPPAQSPVDDLGNRAFDAGGYVFYPFIKRFSASLDAAQDQVVHQRV